MATSFFVVSDYFYGFSALSNAKFEFNVRGASRGPPQTTTLIPREVISLWRGPNSHGYAYASRGTNGAGGLFGLRATVPGSTRGSLRAGYPSSWAFTFFVAIYVVFDPLFLGGTPYYGTEYVVQLGEVAP